jgi:hypothetical protein
MMATSATRRTTECFEFCFDASEFHPLPTLPDEFS